MNLKITLLLITVFVASCSTSKTGQGQFPNLLWSDEFDKDGLVDESKWSYDLGDGCPHLCGWGNRELQYYTLQSTKNARVENGKLIIEAHKESKKKSAYTSARLITKTKGDFLYGKIEVRAKLPSGKGTWPAIWMLPTDRTKYGPWPACGEIDIMEFVGHEPDSIHGTVHTQAYNHRIFSQKGGSIAIKNLSNKFHTYTILWNEKKIEWFIDDKKYFEFQNEEKTFKEWPFDQPFHLILNLAVGGTWGGEKGVDDSIWPQRMEIDYVRVYQN